MHRNDQHGQSKVDSLSQADFRMENWMADNG
jgi:hypothetical protein